MIDYTINQNGRKHPIVRGHLWPPGTGRLILDLTDDINDWEAGVHDAYDWELLFHRQQRGGAPDLIVAAESAEVIAEYLRLIFVLTPAQTAQLAGTGETRAWVDLRSTAADVESIWPTAAGVAFVRDRVGAP